MLQLYCDIMPICYILSFQNRSIYYLQIIKFLKYNTEKEDCDTASGNTNLASEYEMNKLILGCQNANI